MASIARRADGHWRARYRDGTGTEHSRHFARKVDAQRWLDGVTTAVTSGTYVDPGRSSITVGEWSHRWLATKVDLKPSTHARYEGLLRVNILPRWNSITLADVTHERIAAWVGELSTSGLSASNVRQAHRVLSLVFSLAVRDGRLARNPADHVPLPRAAKRERVFLTIDQVDELAEAAGDHRVAILFLAYTGVRFGELSALRVRRLDLLRRRAEIAEAVAEVHGRATFSSPKSHQVRSVPIPRFLVDDLIQLVAGKEPDDFVFTAPKGGLLRLQNFRHGIFDRVVRATGLDGLGHATATMTLDLYGHLYGDRLDEVADRMDAARTSRGLAADFLRTNHS